MSTLPNYRQGFVNLDPATGLPKMLGTTRNAPTDLGRLIGAPGAIGAIPGLGGPIPAPVDTYGTVVPGANPMLNVGPSGALPNYLLDQTANNLSSALRGELPQDVQDLLAQQAAEYGVGSGTQGSQFAGYRGLRNLGLTSLDRMKDAENLLAGQFLGPGQSAQLDLERQRMGEGQRQFGLEFGQRQKEYADRLALEQQRFASEQNQLQRQLQMQELEALGLKYGGGGSVSGGSNLLTYRPPGQRQGFNRTTGTNYLY